MDASVRLSVEQWNQVLDMMSDASVKRAMPLINEIMRQVNQQTQMEQQTANGPRQDNSVIPNRDDK